MPELPPLPRLMACAGMLLALMLTSAAQAQSYVDRNFSVSPAVREAQRPIIVAPVQPTGPTVTPAMPPKNGPVSAYASDVPGLDIRQGNTDYLTRFTVVGRVPAGSSIRNVQWRYGAERKPKGFEAVLCWQDASTCWSVSEASSGSTTYFNGRDANQPFLLIYRVKGPAELAPIKGAVNQVIVTYDVPR